MFSVDDCVDYQADFVLATLLDETSPSQPSASAPASGSLSSGAGISTRKHVPETRHGVNGDRTHRTGTDRFDQSHLDDTIIDQSNTSYPPSHTGASARTEGQRKVSSKSAEDVSDVGFPSGSQFNNVRTGGARTKSPFVAHVPPPPTDTDYMDIDPSLPKTSVLGSRDKSIRGAGSGRTDDVMDALFGDGHFTDVAEEGVGHAPGGAGQSRTRLPSEGRVSHEAAALPGGEDDAFPDDFPFEGTSSVFTVHTVRVAIKPLVMTNYWYVPYLEVHASLHFECSL